MQTRARPEVRRKVARALTGLACLAVACPAPARAQTAGDGAEWRVVAADSSWTWPAPPDDPGPALLDSLASEGYLLARVDSLRADTAFVWRGDRAAVRRVEVVGATALAGPTQDWRTAPGAPFRRRALEGDLAATAARYARLGYARAQLVPQVDVAEGGRAVDVTVRVDEGAALPVTGVELAGARGRNRAFATRRAGLDGPTPAGRVDPDRVRAGLEATGLYAEVGTPVLAIDADGGLVLQVPVVEAPPGAFDVVLGYLPPTGTGGGGVVGRGQVDLRNPFGGGRTATAVLERTPGLVSAFALDLADPYLFGSPFGVALSFAGSSRDSTLARQRLGADVSYAFDPTFELVASVASESVRPGTFGAGLVDGRPRVRRTDEVLLGVGLRLTRLDRPRNPRRGVALGVLLEQGRRAADEFGPSARRRLGVRARLYTPTLARQALVLGLDAAVTQQRVGAGAVVDEGDLVRFGGAASFRGYDEQALLARSYGRAVGEYRLLFDDASFAFAFVDAGALDRPAIPGAAAETRALVGYGAGLRVRTGLGLATVTYALNPDLSVGRGKVHVGLTVGL